MAPPLNLDNLRLITGGDAAMEAELFQMFLASSTACMLALRAALAEGDEAAWRREAHAFKGICFNLGAEPLGELCKKAQEDCRAPPDEKKAMLTVLEQELARVRQAVEECVR